MHTKQTSPKHTPELFYLPRMTPHPDWVTATAYVIGDFVTVGDFEYRCVVDHTSSATFAEDMISDPGVIEAKWTKIGRPPYTYEDLPDNPGTFIDVPVYDYPHQEETYASGKGLRRRGKPKPAATDVPVDQTTNARLQKITGKQHFFVDGYYDGDPVYTYEIKAEYWDGNSWEFQELDGTITIDNDLGVVTCSGVQGSFEWDIKIGFSALNKKWEWDVTASGFLVRLVWIIDFTALGQTMVADGDIVLDHSDYTGNVSDDEGVVQRTILFEENGIDATSGWVVDPYLSVDDAGSTIVITTGAETITFTVATENALLMDGSNPLRAVVKDDVCWWYIYDLRMFAYQHTAGTPGSGMALTTDHGAGFPYVVSGDWDWYPLTAGEETAKTTRLAQFQDTTMPAMTTGTEQEDWVLPTTVGTSGITYDSGRRIEAASDVAKYTSDSDKARIGHADVVEMGHYTGDPDSPTDHLVGHWKMDDNAASTIIVDATGSNDGSLAGGDNTSVLSNTDAVRGTSLLTNGTDDQITIDAMVDLATDDEFTIMFDFKPNFGVTDGDQYLCGTNYDNNNRIYFNYDSATDVLRFVYEVGSGGAEIINIHDFTGESDALLQQWRTVSVAVNITDGWVRFEVQGFTPVINYHNSALSWAAALPSWTFGEYRSSYGAAYWDNVKLLDGCKLPYGAYFTGNGSVDTAVAHSDITFLWQGADATPIGTDVTNDGGDYDTDGPIGTKAFDNAAAGQNASAATSGNISAAEGSLSFWFKPNSALGADCTLFYADAAFKIWWDDSDNDVVFTYNTDVLNMGTAFAAGDTNWHHIHVMWKASDSLYINVDGVETSLLTGVDAAPTLDGTMYFTADDADGTNRANVLISDFFITDTLGTPQISTYLGSGPEHAPMVQVD